MTTFQATLQLRIKAMQLWLETLGVFFAALFVTAILPSLMVRYLYADAQLLEQPKSLEYVPVVSFAIATLFFLYTVLATLSIEMKIKRMAKSEAAVNPSYSTGVDEKELKELEHMVDKALAKQPARRGRKAVVAKKTSRRKTR